MSKTNYESPNFDFHEMRLMERVAEVCWGGSHHGYYDWDQNGKFDGDDLNWWVEGNSCDEVSTKLEQWLIENRLPYTPGDVHENVNSKTIQEIYS